MSSQALQAPPSAVRSGRWLRVLGPAGPAQAGHPATADSRRRLQLVLAGIWLLDAVLQFQAFMFTKGFARMLAANSAGNPAIVAGPVGWVARLTGDHGTTANAVFAAIQLLIALCIAWRPAVRFGLAASVVWAIGVWWIGEGLGGLLSGTASPLNGAPGAVIIYALLAVLLWPARQEQQVPFAAGLATGAAAARAAWLVLWGSLAYLALQPATAAAGAMSGMIARMAAGQPAWLASTDTDLAAVFLHSGPATAIALAVILAVAAIGVYLPSAAARAVLILAIVTAAAMWVAEGLGGILTGGGTDPNSGPLLALLALAFWPAAGGIGPTAARDQDSAGSYRAASDSAASDSAASDSAASEAA